MTSINDLTGPHERGLGALSDDDLLEQLTDLEPLPDETDPRWDEEGSSVWDRAGEFLAFADEVASRRISRGVRLLLDKACFGDPYETMRGLRHSLEGAVGGHWSDLTVICVGAAGSDRPGTRLWAVNELAILRDPAATQQLGLSLTDQEPLIRAEACRAAEMLGQTHPEAARSLLDQLIQVATTDADDSVRRAADSAVTRLNP